MEDLLKELVLQAPAAGCILIVVVAFLRHLSKHNESMAKALKENSDAICQVASALARLESRVTELRYDRRRGE